MTHLTKDEKIVVAFYMNAKRTMKEIRGVVARMQRRQVINDDRE